jgi:hypothetical protein
MHGARADRRTALQQVDVEIILSQPLFRNIVYAWSASVALLERYAFMRRGRTCMVSGRLDA